MSFTQAEIHEIVTTLYEGTRLAERVERDQGPVDDAAQVIAIAERTMRNLGAELVRVEDLDSPIAGCIINWRWLDD